MKNRYFISAGIFMLCFFCAPAFAQTQIRHNAQSRQDSVTVELPNNVKLLLITDDINKLQQLEKINLDSVVRNVNQQLETSGAINPKTNTAGAVAPDSARKKPDDMILLWAGIGTGLIRDKWIPKIAPVVTLRHKGKEYAVSYDMNFFFEREENRKYKLYLNSFLDLGFGFRPSPKKEPNVYHRVSAGYLINSSGAYFGKNTFRLSYAYPVAKSVIRIIPELYFTDKFKTIFPGLSVRF